jgi:hypothetical protein
VPHAPQDGGLEVLKLFGIDGYGGGLKEPRVLVILLELGGVAGPLYPGHKGCRYLNEELHKKGGIQYINLSKAEC